MATTARVSGAKWIVTLLVTLGLATGAAQAGVLASDPNAMPAWRGTVTNSYVYDGIVLDIELDYAAFDVGNYPGTDPSGGAEYVYAYQVASLATSNVGLRVLSVGLEVNTGANSIGEDTSAGAPGAAGDVANDLASIGATSAKWGYGLTTGPELLTGQISNLLLFTSPNPPRLNNVAVTDGGLPVNVGEVASPTPEPATLALLGIGAMGLLRKHRRR